MEIKPVNPKGNQSWIFFGRTDTEAEAPRLWPPDAKNWLVGKDPDAGKDWRQEKWTTEDEMVGWHHQLDGHEFEQALGVGDGQGSMACCSPWGHKESDITEWLNWQEPLNTNYVPKTWLSNWTELIAKDWRNFCVFVLFNLANLNNRLQSRCYYSQFSDVKTKALRK